MRNNINRKNNELRPISIIRHYTKHAEGSVLIKFGDTHIICTASVLNKVPFHIKGTGKGWITAEYSMLPRATNIRTDREAAKGKQTGRTQEIQRLIGRSLRAAIDLRAVDAYTIHIDCDVIQADGGTRTASITGAWVALYDAVSHMVKNNLINHMPNIINIAAVSVGILNNQTLLDLDYIEDSSCDTDLNLVMNNSGIIEIQGTAEGKVFSKEQLDKMLEYGMQGIEQLFAIQNQSLSLEN